MIAEFLFSSQDMLIALEAFQYGNFHACLGGTIKNKSKFVYPGIQEWTVDEKCYFLLKNYLDFCIW